MKTFITQIVSGFFIILIILIPAGLFWVLAKEASLAWNAMGWTFWFKVTWDPVRDQYGALSMLWGSFVSSLLAVGISLLIAVPTAIFVVEFCPFYIQRVLSHVIQVLAIFPSIVYGFWGFSFLSPLMGEIIEPWLKQNFQNWIGLGFLFSGNPTGLDLLTTILVLSVMILPFQMVTILDALNLVSDDIRHSALAMGFNRHQVAWLILLPKIRLSVAAGSILAAGRALGEAMAVSFVAGNKPQIPKSLFDAFNTVASALANQFTEADKDLYLSALYLLALGLFISSFLILSVAKMITRLNAQQG